MKKLFFGFFFFIASSFLIVYAANAYGDVNLDGNVDINDAVAILKYLDGDTSAISAEGLTLADLNSDGNIDEMDVTILMKHLKGFDGYQSLPISSDIVSYAYGDVNLDEKVDINDAVAMLKYIEGNKNAISAEGLKLADLNSDGDVDKVDVTILMRHLVGWEGYELLPISSDIVIYAYGDVNLDDNVDTNDAVAMLKYIAGDKSAISAGGLKLADLNIDGNIDDIDVTILSRHLAGWEEYKLLPLSPSSQVAPNGDLNNDGKIDDNDLNILKDKISKKDDLTDVDKLLADINRDGELDEKDIKALKDIISAQNIDNPKTGDNIISIFLLTMLIVALGTISLYKLKFAK